MLQKWTQDYYISIKSFLFKKKYGQAQKLTINLYNMCRCFSHYVETNFDDWEESFIRPQISTIILFSVLDQKSSFFLLLFLVNSNIIFYCYVQLQKLVENCSILKEKSSYTYYLFCRIVVTHWPFKIKVLLGDSVDSMTTRWFFIPIGGSLIALHIWLYLPLHKQACIYMHCIYAHDIYKKAYKQGFTVH